MTQPDNEPSFAEYIHGELLLHDLYSASTRPLLDYIRLPSDGQEPAWPPLTVTEAVAYVQVPHELLVDSGGHVCDDTCPPPEPPYVPPHRTLRQRLAIRRRRAWYAVRRMWTP